MTDHRKLQLFSLFVNVCEHILLVLYHAFGNYFQDRVLLSSSFFNYSFERETIDTKIAFKPNDG